MHSLAVASIPQIWSQNRTQLPPSFGLRFPQFLIQVFPSILGFWEKVLLRVVCPVKNRREVKNKKGRFFVKGAD